jgi:hypothetical protein
MVAECELLVDRRKSHSVIRVELTSQVFSLPVLLRRCRAANESSGSSPLSDSISYVLNRASAPNSPIETTLSESLMASSSAIPRLFMISFNRLHGVSLVGNMPEVLELDPRLPPGEFRRSNPCCTCSSARSMPNTSAIRSSYS